MSERKRTSGRSSAERVVSDLARRGEMRARDVQKLAREFFDRAERNRKELTGLIQKEIRRQVKALGLATQQDVDRLRKRIRELEQSGAKRAPRATTRKPSAAKKR